MLKMCSGCLVMAAKATESRRIVPLPLFLLPSISNKTRFTAPRQLEFYCVNLELQIINKRPLSILEFKGEIISEHREREAGQACREN